MGERCNRVAQIPDNADLVGKILELTRRKIAAAAVIEKTVDTQLQDQIQKEKGCPTEQWVQSFRFFSEQFSRRELRRRCPQRMTPPWRGCRTKDRRC